MLDMFRALTCPSSGGKIVFTQHLVSSLSVNGWTVHRLRAVEKNIKLYEYVRGEVVLRAYTIVCVCVRVYCVSGNSYPYHHIGDPDVIWTRNLPIMNVLLTLTYRFSLPILTFDIPFRSTFWFRFWNYRTSDFNVIIGLCPSKTLSALN